MVMSLDPERNESESISIKAVISSMWPVYLLIGRLFFILNKRKFPSL